MTYFKARRPLHALVTERSNLSQLAMCRPPQLVARSVSPVPNVGTVLGQSAPGTAYETESVLFEQSASFRDG